MVVEYNNHSIVSSLTTSLSLTLNGTIISCFDGEGNESQEMLVHIVGKLLSPCECLFTAFCILMGHCVTITK